MKDLYIKSTEKSFEVSLKDSHISFSGCSINNDPRNFFVPIREWVREYLKDPASTTVLDFKIEYIDTSTVKYLFEILRELVVVKSDKYGFVVNWHYEKYDPEILELGEILQNKLDVKFNFYQYIEG